MLRTVTSAQLSEWMAYFNLKENYGKEQQAEEEAKKQAKTQGR